jgi:hypothetical protein
MVCFRRIQVRGAAQSTTVLNATCIAYLAAQRPHTSQPSGPSPCDSRHYGVSLTAGTSAGVMMIAGRAELQYGDTSLNPPIPARGSCTGTSNCGLTGELSFPGILLV